MTASLIIVEHQDALLIPEEAVIAEGNERYVFVVSDATALRLPIATGIRSGGEIEVTSGLTPDAQVITRGHQKLRDKAPVRLLQQSETKPAEKNNVIPAGNEPTAGSS
jgi:membrane fusion protein (multidrug efflux system)